MIQDDLTTMGILTYFSRGPIFPDLENSTFPTLTMRTVTKCKDKVKTNSAFRLSVRHIVSLIILVANKKEGEKTGVSKFQTEIPNLYLYRVEYHRKGCYIHRLIYSKTVFYFYFCVTDLHSFWFKSKKNTVQSLPMEKSDIIMISRN